MDAGSNASGSRLAVVAGERREPPLIELAFSGQRERVRGNYEAALQGGGEF